MAGQVQGQDNPGDYVITIPNATSAQERSTLIVNIVMHRQTDEVMADYLQ